MGKNNVTYAPMKEDIRISTEMRSYRECQNCHENEGLWLDAVKGEVLSDGSVSDGSGEYLSICLDCYDERLVLS